MQKKQKKQKNPLNQRGKTMKKPRQLSVQITQTRMTATGVKKKSWRKCLFNRVFLNSPSLKKINPSERLCLMVLERLLILAVGVYSILTMILCFDFHGTSDPLFQTLYWDVLPYLLRIIIGLVVLNLVAFIYWRIVWRLAK